MATHTTRPPRRKAPKVTPVAPPSTDVGQPLPTAGPQFAEPTPTADPTKFTVQHGSDNAAYTVLDKNKGHIPPRPFRVVAGVDEPIVRLADALGTKGAQIVADIASTEQIVFHSLGDTGNTRGPGSQSEVSDKMVADYDDANRTEVPSFLFHLGDLVYSFGEAQYYFDQFYEPYRDYPAPIFAIPGNHDGMPSPLTSTPSLQSFYDNFCTAGQPPHRTPESGELSRTAQVQPSVYFTLEAPFVRILGLYSNCLEDPGVISDQGGMFPYLGQTQVNFLKAALKRVKTDKFAGAVIIAAHHPPYVAQTKPPRETSRNAGRHGGSPLMLKDIDSACEQAGVWPHAVLSGHAHSYQRFTRTKDNRETPFFVCGNGGHAPLQPLTKKGDPALRVPMPQPTLSDGSDSVTFESYDFTDFGYLRIIVTKTQLRIEYHPASDGADSKTPDDFATVDLATRKLVHFRGA
jgi:Calcineurin-like phosphoesterase